MELILTKKTLPHKQCLRVALPLADELSWVSMFYQPTEEERKSGWTENLADLPVVIQEFSRISIPAQSVVYAWLETNSEAEYLGILEDLHKTSLPLVTMEELRPRSRWLRWLGNNRRPKSVLVANADWQHVSKWYESYDGWRITPYKFLVSDKPLRNWADELLSLETRWLEKEFLKRIGRLLTNHFDHGIEVIGLNILTDEFESVARGLSKRLKVSLEIRDEGTPA